MDMGLFYRYYHFKDIIKIHLKEFYISLLGTQHLIRSNFNDILKSQEFLLWGGNKSD